MSKFVCMATWDDVPHITKQQKEELWASIPPFQRDARSKGIPQLGSGAIYPVSEAEIMVEPFPIPKYWPKAYGMDVGWNRTACVWGATDDEAGVTYIYSEHYRQQAEPAIHAEAIRSRGSWITGVIDPSARQRSQIDGLRLIEQYSELNLNLEFADNSIESGLMNVWEMLSTGKLKIFSNLQNWRSEYRLYRRDEKGKIVKQNDHLMDATRYLVQSGLRLAMSEPSRRSDQSDWMSDVQRSGTTGY